MTTPRAMEKTTMPRTLVPRSRFRPYLSSISAGDITGEEENGASMCEGGKGERGEYSQCRCSFKFVCVTHDLQHEL